MTAFPPVAECGRLSNRERSCLIAPNGAVGRRCLPRPDSARVFGALLDRAAGLSVKLRNGSALDVKSGLDCPGILDLLRCCRQQPAAPRRLHPAAPGHLLLRPRTAEALTILLVNLGVTVVILGLLDWSGTERPVNADIADAAAVAVPAGGGAMTARRGSRPRRTDRPGPGGSRPGPILAGPASQQIRR